MKTKLTPIVMTALLMAGCSGSKSPKSLVLYYSQTGATKVVAERLAEKTGADIVAIEVTPPYDGSYEETIQRVGRERAEGILPELCPIDVNPKDYDIVYLGYPIWYGTYAPPIAALLEQYSFEGKKIVPFCTFGSGGLEASSADLAANLPEAAIQTGYGVRNARLTAASEELDYFLIANGHIEGKVEALPDFSEPQPVSDKETGIFHAACDSYPMPLGTPVSAGCRHLSDGKVEYEFTVNTFSPTGKAATGKIYVTCAPDCEPEFTRVVR